MIGSDTFIIVALRWTEKSTPCALGVGDLLGEELVERRAAHDGGVEHLAGEHPGVLACRSSRRRRRATCSIRTAPASPTVVERSVQRKSPPDIVATCDVESGDQAPMRCGCARAKALADAGARRSELPSRRTGLTALPLRASYVARAGADGSSG